VGYSHNLTPDSPWIVELGGGLFWDWTEVQLAEASETTAAEVKDSVILPYIHTVLGYQLSRKWAVYLGGDGTYLQEDSMISAGPYASFNISDSWQASGGYKIYGRDIATDSLANNVRYDVPWLSVSYLW